MKAAYLLASLALLCVTSFDARSQTKNRLIQEGATPTLVAADFKFTEGPAVDPEGDVFFTDQPNNRILKWTPGVGVSVYMEDAGRANGLYFDHDGNLLACADAENELWRIDKEKNVTVLVDDFQGKKLNGPNDLWIDDRGGVYFTDPFYKRDYWTRGEKEIEEENVYYLSPDGKKLTIASSGFVRPNGIVGSPDGKTLYVADIRANKTYAFEIGRDGALSNRRLFAPMGSDGMTIDRKGNLYLTGKGVTVFNRRGEQILHIPIDQPWTANICFGGKDLQTLFITASTAVYTLPMKVKGVR